MSLGLSEAAVLAAFGAVTIDFILASKHQLLSPPLPVRHCREDLRHGDGSFVSQALYLATKSFASQKYGRVSKVAFLCLARANRAVLMVKKCWKMTGGDWDLSECSPSQWDFWLPVQLSDGRALPLSFHVSISIQLSVVYCFFQALGLL